jgi:hypothetical protein
MVSILRQIDKARRLTKFHFGKARFLPTKTKRTGPEIRADALGEVTF